MLPSCYVCSGCRETFGFKFRSAYYHVGAGVVGTQVSEDDLLSVPVRPGWCKDCASLCVVEDIAPLRTFELAYGAARAGRPVEYPLGTDFLDATESEREVGAYLRWRMGRRHAARALCCGGSNFQFMDVPQPLIKHAECDFGFIEPQFMIAPHCGSPPGIHSPANIRLYTTEGILIGLLTWLDWSKRKWGVAALSYVPRIED